MLVILDQGSLGIGTMNDINLKPITDQFKTWQAYDNSSPLQTIKRLKNASVVVTNKAIINEAIIRDNPQLKLICIAATGTNNVDLHTAKKAGIAVCNVTGYATPSVVQHVFSLMLALQNNLLNYTKRVSNGEWDTAEYFCLLSSPISELQGKTLGIIGYGELGKAVEGVAKAFGMNVLISASLAGDAHKCANQNRTPLNEVLTNADIITLHCPLSDTTKNLINADMLKKMKPTAFLINTARGGIVNEEDLANALDAKQIAGAALDVLSTEPPLNNVLLQKKRDNLIITPHIAWASQQARQRLINEIGENIVAFNNNKYRNRVES